MNVHDWKDYVSQRIARKLLEYCITTLDLDDLFIVFTGTERQEVDIGLNIFFNFDMLHC